VSHTFPSHLSLCASLRPYAGVSQHRICEYSFQLRQLAVDPTNSHVRPDRNGEIVVPEAPGLGVEVMKAGLEHYEVDVENKISGRTLFPVGPRV
jgi:L-alanine-DL-glutamate epimerase-like enolase superfamily enzyme